MGSYSYWYFQMFQPFAICNLKSCSTIFTYLDWYSCLTTLAGLEYSCLTGGSRHCSGGGGVTLWALEAIDRSSAASSTSWGWPLAPQLKSVGASGNVILGESLGDLSPRSLEVKPPKSLADLGVAGVKKSKTELQRQGKMSGPLKWFLRLKIYL